MRRWRIRVDGFESYTLEAPTRAKAKAKAWCQYCDGWQWCSFRAFWPMVSVRLAQIERLAIRTEDQE